MRRQRTQLRLIKRPTARIRRRPNRRNWDNGREETVGTGATTTTTTTTTTAASRSQHHITRSSLKEDVRNSRERFTTASDVHQANGYTKTTKEIAECVGQVYSGNARAAIKSLKLPVFNYPSDPVAKATEMEKRKWQKRVDSTVVKDDRVEEDKKKMYSLIWGQCTESLLCAKLEAVSGYTTMKDNYDTIDLLKSIKD
jgi:hypothetical protein